MLVQYKRKPKKRAGIGERHRNQRGERNKGKKKKSDRQAPGLTAGGGDGDPALAPLLPIAQHRWDPPENRGCEIAYSINQASEHPVSGIPGRSTEDPARRIDSTGLGILRTPYSVINWIFS